MDKQELIKVLQDLDTHLSSSCDVILVGGAAMILYFGASRITRDVDMILLRGDIAVLRQAITVIAQEHNLPENWMSDVVKGFADILPRDFYHRLVPLDLQFKHLGLYVLGRPEQVAMKIVALREQDLEDLELLLPQMSKAEKDVLVAIIHHVGLFRPDWAQKIQYFLLEQGWKIE